MPREVQRILTPAPGGDPAEDPRTDLVHGGREVRIRSQRFLQLRIRTVEVNPATSTEVNLVKNRLIGVVIRFAPRSGRTGVVFVVYERPGAGGGGDVVVGQAVDGEVVDGAGLSCGLRFYYGGAIVVGVRVFGGVGGGVQAVAGGQVLGLGPAGSLDPEAVGGGGGDGPAVVGGHPPGDGVLVHRGVQDLAGLVGPRVGVVGQDPVADLNLGDGSGGPVGHDHGGVGGEARPPGQSLHVVGDLGRGAAGQTAADGPAAHGRGQAAHGVGEIGRAHV